MIKLFIKRFIRDYEQVEDKKVRESYSVLSGTVGIFCNLFLFGVKLTIGMLMSSIAIISDAFNNLSDTGSSFISIIGAKMSNRHPDKEHPFGHGRLEYISALIVSFLIMIVGFELLKSSFDKILNPQGVEFNLVLIAILTLSVLVKVWMFSYNRYIAKKIHSGVIRATAFDSINDVYATGAVIVSTILGKYISFPVDGVVGLGVSILVMYTGFSIAKDTIDILLGNPPSEDLVHKLNDIIVNGEGIVGVHDLLVHDYGPGRMMVSVHAEVPDDVDIIKTHEIIDAIEQRILEEMGIHIVIHMDPISVNCQKTEELKNQVCQIVQEVNEAFSIHDFRMTDGENRIHLIFDLAVPCNMTQDKRKAAVDLINEKLKSVDERYVAVIQIDNAF